ncbi:MAG: RNA polymerase sigma factor [Phycisphaerae bacterium]
MANILTEAEQYLLDQIRQGRPQAWEQFVDRYQGRLEAFARSKLRRPADAEDLVQDAFMSFVQSLGAFRGQASLETYLFAILRRKIINWSRGRKSSVCLLQDALPGGSQEDSGDAADRLAAPDQTASWYVRRDEEQERRHEALAQAMQELVDGFKQSLNFRDLKIAEMLFYCRLRNKDVANIAGVRENHVAVTKHRYLKQLAERMTAVLGNSSAASDDSFLTAEGSDAMLCEIWRERRLSCLKRSTIGAYLLGTLDPDWQDYVTFHLERLGCQFCRANLDDLRRQTADDKTRRLRDRIMESTVGFLRKP